MFTSYKVLQTSSLGYLHKQITLHPTHATHSSASVTLLQPSVVSSLQITDRSFSHAAPRLWKKIPSNLRTPLHDGHHDPPCDTPVNGAVIAGNNSQPPLHLSHSLMVPSTHAWKLTKLPLLQVFLP